MTDPVASHPGPSDRPDLLTMMVSRTGNGGLWLFTVVMVLIWSLPLLFLYKLFSWLPGEMSLQAISYKRFGVMVGTWFAGLLVLSFFSYSLTRAILGVGGWTHGAKGGSGAGGKVNQPSRQALYPVSLESELLSRTPAIPGALQKLIDQVIDRNEGQQITKTSCTAYVGTGNGQLIPALGAGPYGKERLDRQTPVWMGQGWIGFAAQFACITFLESGARSTFASIVEGAPTQLWNCLSDECMESARGETKAMCASDRWVLAVPIVGALNPSPRVFGVLEVVGEGALGMDQRDFMVRSTLAAAGVYAVIEDISGASGASRSFASELPANIVAAIEDRLANVAGLQFLRKGAIPALEPDFLNPVLEGVGLGPDVHNGILKILETRGESR